MNGGNAARRTVNSIPNAIHIPIILYFSICENLLLMSVRAFPPERDRGGGTEHRGFGTNESRLHESVMSAGSEFLFAYLPTYV